MKESVQVLRVEGLDVFVGDRVEVLPRSVEGDLDGGRNASFSSLHLDEGVDNMKIMIGS